MIGFTSKTVSPVSYRGTEVSGAGLRSDAVVSRRRKFHGCALRPDPVGFGHTSSQGKRRVGHKRSGRCPTNYGEEGSLRRGGGRRFE